MSRRLLLLFVLIASVVLLFADPADAVRRRRRNYNYQYYYTTGSVGSMRVASTWDDESADYRELSAYYDYDEAGSNEVAFTDKLRVFLMLHDEELKNDKQQLVAEVKLTDMSKPDATQVLHYPVKLSRSAEDQYTCGVIDVKDVKPGTVYRLFVNLHHKSPKYDAKSVVGRVPTPYYVATAGESSIEKARQHIVMRTFREWYCTQRGWHRCGEYVMDCHDYYRWAAAPCTVGASYGRANLEQLFNGQYSNGGQIKALTEEAPIHADYVRIPGHTFMLLAYDQERHEVLTMEGNFGSSIGIAVRSVGSGWTVGHLQQEHLRPDLYPQPEMDEVDADVTASRERSPAEDNTGA